MDKKWQSWSMHDWNSVLVEQVFLGIETASNIITRMDATARFLARCTGDIGSSPLEAQKSFIASFGQSPNRIRSLYRWSSHKELPKVDKKMNGSKKMVSVFDALRQDTDSEEEVEVSRQAEPVIENFPALGSTVKKVEVTLPQVKSEVKTGWATIVSKPKEDADFRWKKELEERSLMKSLPQSALKPQEAKKEVKQLPYVKDYSKPIYTKSWADWTDSDTDEDEEDEMPEHNPVLKRETNMAPGWSTNFVMDDDW